MILPDQSKWEFLIIVETGNIGPAIEATTANVEALRELTIAASGHTDTQSRRQAAIRSPSGERGGRYYWIESKKRWVKIVAEEDVDGSKKRRTLTRKPSHTAALEPLTCMENQLDTSFSQTVPSRMSHALVADEQSVDAACASLFEYTYFLLASCPFIIGSKKSIQFKLS